MNLEGPKTAQEKEEKSEIQQNIERKFGERLRCFTDWARIGVAVGAIFVAGETAKSAGSDEEYEKYLESSMSAEQLEQMKANNKRIEKIFGSVSLKQLIYGDAAALRDRKKGVYGDPPLRAFDEKEWENTISCIATEENGAHPRRWIKGEVTEIKYIDYIQLDGERGKFRTDSGIDIYRISIPPDKPDKPPIDYKTLEHEFGHANDWEFDMDMNIIERQELLLKTFDRVTSTDAYHRPTGGLHYEINLSGDKIFRYVAAAEYWADLCAEYFTDAEGFRAQYPKDFKIVDDQVKKNDPSFNIFDPKRMIFDPKTGEFFEINKPR